MRNHIVWFPAIIVVLWSGIGSATIIDVPADYSTIQMAIDSSSIADSVLVQPGVYFENINFNGHDIVLGSLFLTTGDTAYISTTIIDGNSSGPVVYSYFGLDSALYLTLAGFTIQNGYTNSPPLAGGIDCISQHDAVIKNNIITHNTGTFIGGVYCSSSIIALTDNIISNNSALYAGNALAGGLGINEGNYLISGNIIFNNHSAHSGGGIGIWIGSFDITNNTIYGNIADSGSGGMYLGTLPGFGNVVNNICWENKAPLYKEIYNRYDYANIIYSNIQDTLWPGTGNISCCPEFCNALGGDFHLALSSCCAGAGSSGVDIGALGVGCDSFVAACDYIVGDVNGDGTYNGLDIVYGVSYFKSGPSPIGSCECSACNIWYSSGDVNGSCDYNGLDIVYGVAYFKGGPGPVPCAECPPIS